MSTPLPKDFERYIDKKVRSGEFASRTDALKTALGLLKARDMARAAHLAEMRRLVQEGIDAADRGDLYPIEGLLDRVKERVEQRSRSLKRRKSA